MPDSITIFPDQERCRLRQLSLGEFAERFANERELLVLRAGEVVVAATRDSDRAALLSAFQRRYPTTSANDCCFLSGPAKLRDRE